MSNIGMIEKLKELESVSRLLDPAAAQRQELLDQAIALSQKYLETIPERPAYDANQRGRDLYDSPFSEEGMAVDQALALMHESVNMSGINPTSSRFLGYIPGGGLFPSAVGDYLAAITNRYSGVFFASPGAVRMENMVLRWMADEVVEYPAEAAGNLAAGGSIANLIAIVTARDAHGITGKEISKSVVYRTEHVHHSNDKALHLVGLGGCIKRQVPVGAGYRMDADALAEAIAADKAAGLNPWLVIASAGTTNTGAVDPLADIADIAAANGLWFHADGAYGAFFALCPEGKPLLKGIERSDSVVMDPHKTLFLPYGTGAVLVKNGAKLYASQNWDADYLQDIPDDIEELSPSELSPELTKHFRGLRMWMPLKLFGLAPFRAALSEKIYLARYFYEKIQQIPGFEVGPYPDLSVVTYRYLPKSGSADAFNERLTKRIQRDGRIFITSTRINGQFILRAAIVSFRTHLDDVNEALDVLKHTVEQLAREGA
jgi:glutamate/tyrosine decarboxylase-like PLP-dependent enzyme